jgi:hypothetical protein
MLDHDFTKNTVRAIVFTEKDCDPKDGEYSVFIQQIIGLFGEDDYGLVKEAINECLDDLDLFPEGWCEVTLIETGEQQDVFWHKYYQGS